MTTEFYGNHNLKHIAIAADKLIVSGCDLRNGATIPAGMFLLDGSCKDDVWLVPGSRLVKPN